MTKFIYICLILFTATALVSCDVKNDETVNTSKINTENIKKVNIIKKYNIPERKKYEHKYKIITKYDKLDDYTDVTIDNIIIGNNLNLRLFFLSRGKTIVTPDSVNVTFVSSSDSWKYLNYRDIRLLLNDDQRMQLPTPEHHGSVGSGYVLEQLSITVPLENFLKIINSDKVEGAIGITEFKLKKNQLEALRDFSSRMN